MESFGEDFPKVLATTAYSGQNCSRDREPYYYRYEAHSSLNVAYGPAAVDASAASVVSAADASMSCSVAAASSISRLAEKYCTARFVFQ